MALDYEALAEIFAEAALEASIPVMSIYRGGRRTRRKSDGSPVTDADEAAEALILKRLAERLPEVPVVAEEAASEGKTARPGPLFLLVDPVDGTLEFLSGNGEFTINIALIADGVPRAGAVYAGARKIVDRRRQRERVHRTARRRPAGAERAQADLGPACAERGAHRAREPLAPQRSGGILPRKAPGDRAPGGRFILEVLPDRGGHSRCLPSFRTDHGMGHGRRGCNSARRWRHCHGREGGASPLRQGGREVCQWAVHRLGRSRGGARCTRAVVLAEWGGIKAASLAKTSSGRRKHFTSSMRTIYSPCPVKATRQRMGAQSCIHGEASCVISRLLPRHCLSLARAALWPILFSRPVGFKNIPRTTFSPMVTGSSARSRAGLPKSSRRQRGAGASPTAISLARRRAAPSSAACAMARGRSIRAMPVT